MQVRSILSATITNGTAGSSVAKLSNFCPNSLVVYFGGAAAITDSALNNIIVSVQFKNRLGKNAVILNNVPLGVLAKMSDYECGWSTNGTDTSGAIRIYLGKVILSGQDEISVSLTWNTSASSGSIECYAIDEAVGKEHIMIYEYAVGSAGQQLSFPSALIAYMDIASPSNAINVRTSDFFDDNLITELQIVSNGAVLGRAENFDNFGCVWYDKTRFTQNLGITCGSSNEKILVREWFYDALRIGVAQSEIASVGNYLDEIRKTDSEKYKCLSYFLRG